MHRRRWLRLLAGGGGVSVAGCGGDGQPAADPVLEMSSSAVPAGGTVPEVFTCDGEDVSPPLTFSDVPAAAGTLAVMVDDPDAGPDPFTHWLIWGLPPDVGALPRAVPPRETVSSLGGAEQGRNGFDTIGYRGPCPPRGDDPHTYRFRVYGLDGSLDLAPGATADAFNAAIDGRLVGTGGFLASYSR